MSEKKVASVGCEIPGGLSEYISIDSDASLLDWDIILFNPSISFFVVHKDTYQGKLSLSGDNSFQLRECSEHWRREITDAIHSNKTVIVFLPELYEVYIDTGERQYSGTGRNQKTTILVDLYNNYKCLPFDLKPFNSKGYAMRLAKGSNLLTSYWSEFSSYSSYRVRIEGQVLKPLVMTKTGDKTVGALIKQKDSAGALLLLPYLNIESEEFYKEKNNGEFEWTKQGQEFGHRLLGAIIEIDKTLKQSEAITPTPEWAKAPDYKLPKEAILREELLKIDKKIENLQRQKQTFRDKLANEVILRRLLFEKGTPLEDAILLALKLMGFSANKYKDSESDFDVVFESNEGRFLGEAEGKDNNAIGIDKLRQLEMNIHEDLAREEVSEPATGVLFGNAYRLFPLNDRSAYFTVKCLKAAKRSGTVLVKTQDLFKVAQYLSGETDSTYAQECRKSILESPGKIVLFPEPPQVTTVKANIKKISEEE
ncbi:hypothetical protein LLG96_16665 [bacterium]|nr:hypothetical protein [bacterium]